MKTQIDSDVGARLRAIREARGLSRADLAQALGVAESVVEAFETGSQRIGAAKLIELAKVLDVSIRQFFATSKIHQDQPGFSENDAAADDEIIRLFKAFDSIEDIQRRRDVVEFAEILARGRIH